MSLRGMTVMAFGAAMAVQQADPLWRKAEPRKPSGKNRDAVKAARKQKHRGKK